MAECGRRFLLRGQASPLGLALLLFQPSSTFYTLSSVRRKGTLEIYISPCQDDFAQQGARILMFSLQRTKTALQIFCFEMLKIFSEYLCFCPYFNN